MKYLYRLITLAFFCVGLPRALWLMGDDLQHPERSQDINHCFPLEAILLVAFVVGLCLVGRAAWRNSRSRQ